MESKERSSTVLNNPQGKINWLEIAEYSALGMSVFGSALTLFLEQILFFAAPITLGLFLNIINRKMFEEKIQKNINNEAQELRMEMNSVFYNIDPPPTTVAEETPELFINSSQKEFNFEYSTITKEDWEAINIKFSDIEEELQLLKILATDLQQNLGSNSLSTNNTLIPNEIEKLQAQITKLQELNRDIVRPYLISLIRAVKQLQNTRKS
ncbi:MAG: hypothetical protein MGF17_02100 [Trichodesmium sp. MAG_R04]|nr:hypothetical protein [Trichodesmium sp. MAG_R04]